MKRQQPRSPLEILQLVAEHFLSTAEALDERVANAIAHDASHGDIVSLMGLSDEKRMKAASVAEKAIPSRRRDWLQSRSKPPAQRRGNFSATAPPGSPTRRR
jgi:hypothetical protein